MLQTIRNHHNTKRYFKEFADMSELVYFGAISKDDEAHVYRGATFSPSCIDTNFCHGTINEYDITALTREAAHGDHEGNIATMKWTVFAIHLKVKGMPHVIIDTKHNNKAFYRSLFARFPRIRRAGAMINHMNVSAAQYFDVYFRPDNNAEIVSLIDDTMLQRMIIDYARYNVEIDNDIMYVYSQGTPNSTRELKMMMSETLWLAETLENRAVYSTSVPTPVQPAGLR